jgi:hypothetical protein
MYRKPFVVQFKELIEEEGYDNITDFINNWIAKGESFESLRQWLILKGVNTTYHNVWINLRQYLTAPFDCQSSYDYKWNTIAKTKGYVSLEEMIKDYKTRLTSAEMAEELGITRRGLNYILCRIDNKGKPFEERYKGARSIGEKHKIEGGFTQISAKKRWEKIVKDKGYNSLTEAVTDMHSKGMNTIKMAEELGVSPKSLKERIQKAEIQLTTKIIPRRKRVVGNLLNN